MRWLTLLLATLAVIFLAPAAHAHGMRTAYVEITELAPGQATVHLRLTSPDPGVGVEADPGCALTPSGDGASRFDRAWALACDRGLTGKTLVMQGLGPVVGESVVWISFADGTTASRIVRAEEPRFELRSGASGWTVVRQYVRLGVVHILTGYDHLLFLALLVLLLRRARSVLLAESAFTLSHSLSFSATALGWIHVSPAAAEACIALSLVLLAADVRVRGAPPRASRGAWLALVFGLVHGLGFAGGLREFGLPEQAVAPALVSFGLGVELGQVAFLVAVLGVLHLVRHADQLSRVKLASVYAAGVVSVYWLVERLVVCVAERAAS